MGLFGTFHAQRRPALLAALLLSLATTFLAAGPALAGGGTSDAAHACQQTGYLALHRSDGSSFADTGECVSYAAKGGTFGTPMPACTVTATTGCLVFNNQTMTAYDGSGKTMTVNGVFSFYTGCQPAPDAKQGECYLGPFPNNLATGAATYTVKDSSGQTQTQGTLTAANTYNTQEGLQRTRFLAAGGVSTCSAADSRAAWIQVTDSAAPTNHGLAVADTWSGLSLVQLGNGDYYGGDNSSTTVSC